MSITRPDWSPDGARIAYVSGEDGNPDIHVMDADGTNKVQLTTYPFSDYDPAWSPDGTRITFVSFREGEGSRQIYVMDAVPESPLNRPVRLTGTLNASEETPDWQPLP
jgi:Tol biopolymer transport system component